MLNDIKLESQFISLEAASGTAALFNAIDRLPPFISMVRNQLLHSVGNENGDPIPANYSKLARRLTTARYTDLASLRVYTPPGLTVSYLTYLNSLEDAEKTVLTIPANVIRPFAFWVARMLSNPAEMATQRNMFEVQDMKLPDIDKLQTQVLAGINGTSKETSTTYGKMVARNADWGQIELKLEELNHHLVGLDRKKILQQVQDLTDNIETLITRVKDDPEEYQFSEQSLSLFAKTCYQVAQTLELYSVYCYQLRLLTVAIEDTQAYLTKFIASN